MHTGFVRRAVSILLVVFAAGGAATAQDTDQLLARGMELHRAGDLLGAVQNYLIALESDPNRADIRSNLGAAYVGLGRITEAVQEYRKALAVRDDPQIRRNLALALYKGGRVPEAIPEFEGVLKADPSSKPAALLLADSLLQMGRHQQVVDLLTPREADFEGDLGFAYVLGSALLELGDTERGQVLIDRIFSKGDSAEARLLMGMAQFAKRDYAAALVELERAIAINPDLPSLQVLYGRVQLNMGDREAAVRAFRRELQQNPNSYEANVQLGTLLRIDQRFDDAMVYLRRAEALQPQDVAVRHNLAATFLGQGQPEKARELLEAVVKDMPSYIDAHVLLATTYYRLKRKEDGDRERQIVEKLTAEAQAKQPGAQDGGAPAPPAPPQAEPPPSQDSPRNRP